MQPVRIYGVYDDGSTNDDGTPKGKIVPISIDSSGNLDIAGTLGTDITTLAGNVVTLNGHVVTLDADVNLLTTAVNAFTATQVSAAPVSGTVTCPSSAGTAIILGTQACAKGLWVTAPSTNTINVVVGTAVGNLPIVMAPGTTFQFQIANANLLFCKSTTTNAAQVLQWMAL